MRNAPQLLECSYPIHLAPHPFIVPFFHRCSAMLQFEKTHEAGESRFLAMNPDGTYKGNLIADAQIMVANAILEGNITNSPGLQVSGVNSINQHIIWWARGVGPESKVYKPRYRCNGDSMHHVIKE